MISQSYEQVMQHKSKSQYSQKGALNMELQLLKSVFLPEKSFDTIIIFSRNELTSMDDDDEESWDGFVEAIRKQLHLYFGQVDDRLSQIEHAVSRKHAKLNTKVDSALLQITDLNKQFKSLHQMVKSI